MAFTSRLSTLACVVSFIPSVAHEATHYAAARPVADDAAFRVEVTGTEAVAVWAPIENRALRAFAFLAPTILGCVLAAIWLVVGIDLSGWQAPFAVGLALYTMPSPADVRGALGDAKQEDAEVDTL